MKIILFVLLTKLEDIIKKFLYQITNYNDFDSSKIIELLPC